MGPLYFRTLPRCPVPYLPLYLIDQLLATRLCLTTKKARKYSILAGYTAVLNKNWGLLLRKTKNQKHGNQLQGHLKWSQPKIMLVRTRLGPREMLIYGHMSKVQTKFSNGLVMEVRKRSPG